MKVTYKYNEGVNNNEKHSQNEQFIYFFFHLIALTTATENYGTDKS